MEKKLRMRYGVLGRRRIIVWSRKGVSRNDLSAYVIFYGASGSGALFQTVLAGMVSAGLFTAKLSSTEYRFIRVKHQYVDFVIVKMPRFRLGGHAPSLSRGTSKRI
jgi:hypothetical protein